MDVAVCTWLINNRSIHCRVLVKSKARPKDQIKLSYLNVLHIQKGISLRPPQEAKKQTLAMASTTVTAIYMAVYLFMNGLRLLTQSICLQLPRLTLLDNINDA